MKSSATCKSCGYSLSDVHSGPCPHCGATGRIFNEILSLKTTFSTHINVVHIRQFYKEHNLYWVCNIIFVVAVSLLSNYLKGICGILISVAISLIWLLITPSILKCKIMSKEVDG